MGGLMEMEVRVKKRAETMRDPAEITAQARAVTVELVAVMANYLPARRAASLDPAGMLREE